jgi:hypothetical protein
MTKEKLLLYGKAKGMEYELSDFFKSNICIPKGEKSHPYADELHAYIEGFQIQQQFIGDDIWYDKLESAISHFDIKYRIKPQELIDKPVAYEWKWAVIYNGKATITGNYFTREEFWDSYSYDFMENAYIIEETKRARRY